MITDQRVRTMGLWVAGEAHPAREGGTFPVTNPVDGTVLAHVARATAADADWIVAAAQHAAIGWAGLAALERERILLRAADLLEANAAKLYDLLVDESGSTLLKARFEVAYGASLLRTAAGEARRLYGETFPNDKPHRLSLVLREPLGVVLSISPFNAPLALLIKMIVFALAAGNAVIAKPSEETPLIGLEFGRILHEAGIPPGVLNIVTGYGQEIGAALVEHPGIQGIAFTGSTTAGVRIGQAAMPTMKRLQLELGGKNPLLVLADMNVQRAADIAAVGAFYHAGQICMSGSRIIVEEAIARPFAEALATKAQTLHLGDLRDERTAYGPVINQRALDKIERHVQAALAGGVELLTGGKIERGLTYQPTVLYNTPHDNLAWCEETFGPVVSVVPVRDLEEAITLANDSVYGLSAGILTNDVQRAFNAARQIKAGGVHIGMHPFQSDSLAPVGGFGMSGLGRSGGHYSIEHFTELKWISVELGNIPLPF